MMILDDWYPILIIDDRKSVMMILGCIIADDCVIDGHHFVYRSLTNYTKAYKAKLQCYTTQCHKTTKIHIFPDIIFDDRNRWWLADDCVTDIIRHRTSSIFLRSSTQKGPKGQKIVPTPPWPISGPFCENLLGSFPTIPVVKWIWEWLEIASKWTRNQ